MLAAVSQSYPSFTMPSLTPQSAKTLSLIILAIHAISNIPTTKAVDWAGYQDCVNPCYHRYPEGSIFLNQCVQNCWNTFTPAR